MSTPKKQPLKSHVLRQDQTAMKPVMNAKSKSEHLKEEMRLRRMFDDEAYFAELYKGIE